jgi:Ribbon-helix-helix protein, copG family
VFYVVHVISVSTRNITLTLDEETLREARVLAAQRGLSVSAFLRLELANLVERQRGYTKARNSALIRLRRGQSLGGGKPVPREELHDRAKLR